MFHKILVVCVGNICRSPVAEVMLQQRLPAPFQVSSAGIAALVGKPMDLTSAEVLEEYGISVPEHRARQLDSALISGHDLILVMEKGHIEAICQKWPVARGKVHLLGKWTDTEIPDPYRQARPAFEHAIKLIDQGVEAWVSKLVR